METSMHNVILPIAVLASLAAASMAMAATPTVTNGIIKSLDSKACTVTLADEVTYQFAPKCDFSKMSAGEKVAVTWTLNGKVNQATAIVASK
jgi:Protein of unknown function (DUF1344)